MNTKEHLLLLLGEECSELHLVACKASRFGLDDIHTGETKREWLTHEFNDILAIVEMLKEEGIVLEKNDAKIKQKIGKTRRFMKESTTKGLLHE